MRSHVFVALLFLISIQIFLALLIFGNYDLVMVIAEPIGGAGSSEEEKPTSESTPITVERIESIGNIENIEKMGSSDIMPLEIVEKIAIIISSVITAVIVIFIFLEYKHTKTSVENTKTSLELARNEAKIRLRPWIGRQDKPISCDPNQKIVSIDIKNWGPSPALQIKNRSISWLDGEDEPLKKEWKIYRKFALAPNETSTQRIELTSDMVTSIQNGQKCHFGLLLEYTDAQEYEEGQKLKGRYEYKAYWQNNFVYFEDIDIK